MGHLLGTRYDNPRFVCQNGTVLQLKPISGLAYNRWQVEYNRKHPQPVAPLGRPLENGAPYYDIEDPHYMAALLKWMDEQQEAMFNFLFGKGVISTPPDNWVNEFGIYEDNLKLAWLFSNLEVSDSEDEAKNELTQLTKAIIGLDMVTEGAIQEAQKN